MIEKHEMGISVVSKRRRSPFLRNVVRLGKVLLLFQLILHIAPADAQIIRTDTQVDRNQNRLKKTRASFLIGPVPGFTTAWHQVPKTTSIPLGTQIELKVLASESAGIEWKGAEEIRRGKKASTAICHFTRLGRHEVSVRARYFGGPGFTKRCVFQVVPTQAQEASVASIKVARPPLGVDESSSSGDLVARYFDVSSIATLRKTGTETYATSVQTELRFKVEVDPPGFGPLMEWRTDDGAIHLGETASHRFGDVGLHDVFVGRPDDPKQIRVQAYKTRILYHQSGSNLIPQGQPVTFEAITEPTGYEGEVTWLAATKFGSASPTLGTGPTFTTVFQNTWGPNGGQWLGIGADNARLGQDQKTGGLSISTFNPATGGVGTSVSVEGAGFTQPLPNYCVRIEGNDGIALTRVTEIDESQLVTQINAVETGLTEGQIVISQGQGILRMPDQLPDGLTAVRPVFAWVGGPDDPVTRSSQTFTLSSSTQRDTCFSADSAVVTGESIRVFLPVKNPQDRICPVGTTLRLGGDLSIGGVGICIEYDAELATTMPIDFVDCTTATCQVMEDFFRDLDPPIEIECTIFGSAEGIQFILRPPSGMQWSTSGSNYLRVDFCTP